MAIKAKLTTFDTTMIAVSLILIARDMAEDLPLPPAFRLMRRLYGEPPVSEGGAESRS